MSYQIRGLEPQQFSALFKMSDAELAGVRAARVVAGVEGRYPCRVSLRDADAGEELVLVNFTNHEVDTPYRNSFAVFVRKDAVEAATYIDKLPPVLRSRPISLRGYCREGNLVAAVIALDDDVESKLTSMLDDPEIAYIDAHNAAHGCFAARIERIGEEE